MKKYWITFLSSLLFATSTIVYFRSLKESDQIENIALDSLIHDYETQQSKIDAPEKVLISSKTNSKAKESTPGKTVMSMLEVLLQIIAKVMEK